MPKILLEGDVVSEFVPDRAKLTEELTASTASGRRGPIRIPGKFSLCDSVNGNNRRYPQRVWEKNLQAGSPLMELVSKRRSIGLLEHPKDGTVSLLSPISHLVTAAKMEGKEVSGEITLIGTAEGAKMAALIEAGYNPYVSSRGYGSVVRATDGVDEVQDDFVCESWDLVANPSFKIAELSPKRESGPAPAKAHVVEAATPIPATGETPEQLFARMNTLVNEGKIKADSVRLVGGTVVIEGSATSISTPAAPATPKKARETTMDIKAIREGVQALRQIDVSKLGPKDISEGLTRMQELHRETAAIVAQDSKLSYDGRTVDRDLDALEQAWTESAQAPAATAARLQEQQGRTFKVLRQVCEVGIKARAKLAESLKTLGKRETLLAEVGRRGNVWRQRAMKAESQLRARESNLSLAYASLDEFARRYHEDTTKLGRAALMLEHKAKIEADAALLKRVTEATRLEHLTAVRGELAGVGAPAAPAKAPAVSEAKAPAAAAPAAPAAPANPPVAPAAPGVRVVESSNRPFTVSGLVESTKRLSEATALVG